MDNFTDIGKGGAVSANVSAVIDRVTVDVLGQAHMLAAVHQLSESLVHDSRYAVLADELAAIRDVLEKISAKESRVEVRQPDITVHVPDIKTATVFTTLKIPNTLIYAVYFLSASVAGIFCRLMYQAF